MDAAKYINTLDRLNVSNVEPAQVEYAIIDLALDSDFLRYLYEAASQSNIQWRSLLENTRWQSGWQAGPILIEFSEHPNFFDSLKVRLNTSPLGILLETGESFQRVFGWAHSLLLAMADSDEYLFRFYDPRSLGPLLATLGEKRKSLLSPGTIVYWSHRGVWQSWPGEQREAATIGPGRLFRAELADLPGYRMADRAISYAAIYRDHLPEVSDHRVWVLEQLLEAAGLGFQSASQQERWLRLGIRNQAPLLSTPEHREIMNAPDLAPADRLNAMESLMESPNATA